MSPCWGIIEGCDVKYLQTSGSGDKMLDVKSSGRRLEMGVRRKFAIVALASLSVYANSSTGAHAAAAAPATKSGQPPLTKGYEQLKIGDLSSACNSFMAVIKQDPDSPMARRYLSYTLLQLGQPGDALSQLIYLTRLQKPSALDWYLFGEAYLLVGSYTQAEAAFNDSLKEDETYAPAKSGLIRVKALNGDFPAAYRMLSEAINDSDNPSRRSYFYRLRKFVQRRQLLPEDKPVSTPAQMPEVEDLEDSPAGKA